MAETQTEERHTQSAGIDLRADGDILALLAAGQVKAAESVAAAAPAIAQGAALAADAIRSGGRLIYAAAGSSGLMALADALELPGTYGLARDRIVVLLAGGNAALTDMRGGPEDDGDAARAAVEALTPDTRDCLIAITASGHTPYPIAAVAAARSGGARTIGLANNAGAAIFETVDVGICLATPAEVIAGSTRMGAGTAQKIALNMLSTLMAIRLGHVHDGYMVNVVADNDKLRGRARGIVTAVAGVDEASAEAALTRSAGAVKPAILLARGVATLAQAEQILSRHEGHLRPSLAEVS
ncbi:N-acetylmuramic acid 6-phosphate etherase [Devosia sp. XJ19-1]|uniref:N-acetylmuramic acid 6-phosphate etherase n=1 Tax=Devosia ureilytica TaxID=2952754 RepID=A0A9Q4AL13_9HYPH|nr:N-acetylmuramic acid 6-phosphate etherase [Devosia ureilytica]MCP8882541.1 N-acetylmuramic acid 6-phosphate etherase [Devosia ureilytica]MCP8885572.1 N-acetylmuramic acid 6-phosphate etherase [Devosia ureilytica]